VRSPPAARNSSAVADRKPASSRGTRLGRPILARAGWVIVAVLTLILFMASLPVAFARFQTLCSAGECVYGQLSRESWRALQGLGLSPELYATYAVAQDIIFAAVYSTIAVLIFLRRPADRMALFVSLALLTFGVATFTDTMDVLAAEASVWRLPDVLLQSVGTITFGLFLYLFPDGRFVPRWTGPVALAWVLLQLSDYLFTPWIAPEGNGPSGWIVILVWMAALGVAIYSQGYRYLRVSDAVQRQQVKWVVFGISAGLSGFIGTNVALAALVPAATTPGALLAHLVGHAISYSAMLLIPLSIGIAILRYKLFDINFIINRTLVYATLTAGVVGVYVLVVGSAGVVLRVQGNLLVSILAAGLVAVLFQPVRERLQAAVNHLMYGKRDDPYAVLSRLGRHLESTLAPDDVLPAVTRTVREALKLPYAEIQLRHREGFETAAAAGDPVEDTVRLPLVYGGEPVGRLVLGLRTGEESFSPEESRLFKDLAHQVGVAAHATLLGDEAIRLSADLQRSRERLVNAREEERRRLRRDLHDGLGPQLASLTMTAEAARDLIATDPRHAEELLGSVMERAQDAVSDVRRLVYGLRPPALDALGLLAALRAHADNHTDGGIRVTLRASEDLPPLPAAVEVAAYRIVMEAINNVVGHAGASNCEVLISLDEEAGTLTLDVSDDGRGIEEDHKPGVGLSSMRERAEELGGSFEVSHMPTGGTRVLARLPLEASGIRHQASARGRGPGAVAVDLQTKESDESRESTSAHEIEELKPDA
jgi:signal transduction histidine kinase